MKNNPPVEFGDYHMPKISVDFTKCNGRGTCVDNCPAVIFELQDFQVYPDSKEISSSQSRLLHPLYDMCDFVS